MDHRYEYPRPAVTVDTVLVTMGEKRELRVLLIQRAKDPFAERWALPGGFVDQDEDLEAAARREMLEETGVKLGPMVQLGAYGTPGRDPRGHTVGIAFLAICGPDEAEGRAGDDAADCRWFALRRPPKLAFDHAVILKDAREEFARLAGKRDDFQRAFCGRRKPKWLEHVRRAAKGAR
ncbi:MAG: NUDIX domain-containing protein [Planctomycetota bacterium]